MARDKGGRGEALQLMISGIPQEWIPPSLEIRTQKGKNMSIEIIGNTRNIVLDDPRFVREFLKKHFDVG